MFEFLLDDTNLGFNPTPKIYKDVSPTLRANRYGLKIVESVRGGNVNNIKLQQVDQIYSKELNPQAGRVYSSDGLSPTLDSCTGGNRMPKIKESTDIRIRKLTPTECYKLMGFTAEDCKKVSEGGISNSQLYKQAGNSIVVNVLEAIFTSLGENYEEFRTVN